MCIFRLSVILIPTPKLKSCLALSKQMHHLKNFFSSGCIGCYHLLSKLFLLWYLNLVFNRKHVTVHGSAECRSISAYVVIKMIVESSGVYLDSQPKCRHWRKRVCVENWSALTSNRVYALEIGEKILRFHYVLLNWLHISIIFVLDFFSQFF